MPLFEMDSQKLLESMLTGPVSYQDTHREGFLQLKRTGNDNKLLAFEGEVRPGALSFITTSVSVNH